MITASLLSGWKRLWSARGLLLFFIAYQLVAATLTASLLVQPMAEMVKRFPSSLLTEPLYLYWSELPRNWLSQQLPSTDLRASSVPFQLYMFEIKSFLLSDPVARHSFVLIGVLTLSRLATTPLLNSILYAPKEDSVMRRIRKYGGKFYALGTIELVVGVSGLLLWGSAFFAVGLPLFSNSARTLWLVAAVLVLGVVALLLILSSFAMTRTNLVLENGVWSAVRSGFRMGMLHMHHVVGVFLMIALCQAACTLFITGAALVVSSMLLTTITSFLVGVLGMTTKLWNVFSQIEMTDQIRSYKKPPA